MSRRNDHGQRNPSHQAKGSSAILRAASGGPTMLEVLPSWELALGAANKTAGTIASYRRTVRTVQAWLAEHDMPVTIEDIQTEHLRAFMTDRIAKTSAGNAAKDRRNLSVWFNWLESEEERTNPNPMKRLDKIKAPGTDGAVFTDDELSRMVRHLEKDGSFEGRRDLALIRVLMDNGVRVSGLAGLRYTPDDEDTNDVQLSRHRLRVTLKGGRQIWVPIGRKAAAALDRYVRIRRRHKAADSEWLWLPHRALYNGAGECRLSASGIHQAIERLGIELGIADCTPHRFRRTMAVNWEGDPLELMDIGGWESLEMVRLYQRARREERAREAHRRLSPGDKI